MGGRPQRSGPAIPELGLERISWVRVLVGAGSPRCAVGGIAHRRPVVRSVPLRTATALIAAGVPGRVHQAPRAPAAAAGR
jgi:hypothetical protein